jgi:hypothetical protein
VRQLRTATLLLVVGVLLLPPRWCCAIPFLPTECCAACKSSPATHESCCGCKTTSHAPAKQRPCKCQCNDQRAQLAKAPEIEQPGMAACLFTLPVTLSAPTDAPHFLANTILPPDDIRPRLCRWLN